MLFGSSFFRYKRHHAMSTDPKFSLSILPNCAGFYNKKNDPKFEKHMCSPDILSTNAFRIGYVPNSVSDDLSLSLPLPVSMESVRSILVMQVPNKQ